MLIKTENPKYLKNESNNSNAKHTIYSITNLQRNMTSSKTLMK